MADEDANSAEIHNVTGAVGNSELLAPKDITVTGGAWEEFDPKTQEKHGVRGIYTIVVPGRFAAGDLHKDGVVYVTSIHYVVKLDGTVDVKKDSSKFEFNGDGFLVKPRVGNVDLIDQVNIGARVEGVKREGGFGQDYTLHFNQSSPGHTDQNGI